MKKNKILFSIFLFSLVLSAQKVAELKTEDEKASYAIGLSLAQSFKPQGFDEGIDLDIMIQAMRDKFEDKELLFSEDSVQAFMTDYIPKHSEKAAKKNREAGEKFLEENKKQSGVEVTASGIQYKVEKEGTGAKPTDEDLVSVNYVLKTIDGSVIEDSKKAGGDKPTDIPLARVVSGWREGVKLMSKGAKYVLYIPAELAYGGQGAGKLGPNSVLIFEIELIDFKSISEEQGQEDIKDQVTSEQMEEDTQNQVQNAN